MFIASIITASVVNNMIEFALQHQLLVLPPFISHGRSRLFFTPSLTSAANPENLGNHTLSEAAPVMNRQRAPL